jgi:hypothetical protein
LEDFGGKFSKWKFTINWFEGFPSPNITIRVFRKEHMRQIVDKLKALNLRGQNGNILNDLEDGLPPLRFE